MYCPNPKCSQFINLDLVDSPDYNLECPTCKEVMCTNCKLASHGGLSCEASKEHKKDEMDNLFKAISATKDWKECAKCNHIIELTYGTYLLLLFFVSFILLTLP